MHILNSPRLLNRYEIYLLVSTLIVFPLTLTSAAQAQQQRLTAEIGTSIVGSGDYYIPSLRLGYGHQIVPHVNASADLRFTRGTPQYADLSYLDGSFGVSLYPVDSDHHRSGLGIGAAFRGRWETRATRVWYNGDGDVTRVRTERRTSADVGYLLRAIYSYKISRSLWLGAQMNGYTYQEGTTVFVLGLSVDYQF